VAGTDPGLLVAGLAAFVVSWFVVRLVRTLALRRGLLDMPNERSSHVQPTPRLGGIGILVAIVVAAAGGAALAAAITGALIVVLLLAAGVSLVSLLDDLRGLPPLARLAVHLATGLLAVWWLGPLDLTAPEAPRLAAQAVTVLWLAGFINAFNFMDGTDGIAGVQALIAGGAWSLALRADAEPSGAVLAVAITGASLGFLLLNWSPASIFMGDVGSALLGFLLAVLPLLADPPASLLMAVLPVWPFVFDTTLTLLRRAARGENVLAAHRSHLYQRLTVCGWPHARTALLYAGLAVAGAAVAVAMVRGWLDSLLPAAAVLVAGPALLWTLVIVQEARSRRGPVRSMPAGRSDNA
jgi:UDP-N-acetylmuramyl pentapeptide phosphotransferase/UDP-N-acetylglucosamine-1-phosphate transferase